MRVIFPVEIMSQGLYQIRLFAEIEYTPVTATATVTSNVHAAKSAIDTTAGLTRGTGRQYFATGSPAGNLILLAQIQLDLLQVQQCACATSSGSGSDSSRNSVYRTVCSSFATPALPHVSTHSHVTTVPAPAVAPLAPPAPTLTTVEAEFNISDVYCLPAYLRNILSDVVELRDEIVMALDAQLEAGAGAIEFPYITSNLDIDLISAAYRDGGKECLQDYLNRLQGLYFLTRQQQHFG